MKQIDEPLLKAYYKSKLKEYKYDLNGESYVLFSKDIKINNCNVSVVVEYDNNRPAYGIYYGIKMNEGDQINDIENIKSYFLDNWWLQNHPGYSELEGNRIFIEGDKGISEDKTFWPIWIRLEDYRNVSEAIDAAKVIYTYLSNIYL